ncbi:MAG: MurR/RpiR family transcriptional regulator [Solobacterium sp.]|nr:MurR/RpiR family transcriptional regulator [Solobacterium sp.]
MPEDTNYKHYNSVRFNPQTSMLAILNWNDESDANFVLARYFLSNFHKIPEMSIYQVADDCYMSRSSVQRFIKTIGFDTFTAFKESVKDVFQHQQSFLSYTDHTDFPEYLAGKVNDMINDINAMAKQQKLRRIAERIHDCRNFYVANAEDSSSSARSFQQQMLAMGKLVRLFTSANTEPELLNSLSEDDFLLTVSASGNYAIAINNEIRQVRAYKGVVTLNHTTLFEETYDFIFYLSGTVTPSERSIQRNRNVFTRYGTSYFFDLLFHEYFVAYQNEIRPE